MMLGQGGGFAILRHREFLPGERVEVKVSMGQEPLVSLLES